MDKRVIRGLKEFQNMGMEWRTMLEPWMRGTSLEEGGKSEAIGLQGVVGENMVVK